MENGQRMTGWIDMLVQTPGAHMIVDHKSFPGTIKDCEEKGREYVPQLRLYQRGVIEATGSKNCGMLVHFPVAGCVVYLA